MKRKTRITAALAFALAAATGAVGAQSVYKCGDGSYSDQSCSSRVVRTYDAPVPVRARSGEGVSRRLPGETVAEFDVRKRRARLKETDRDECVRLDKRIAVDMERTKAHSEDEVDDAQAALAASRKRYRQLGC